VTSSGKLFARTKVEKRTLTIALTRGIVSPGQCGANSGITQQLSTPQGIQRLAAMLAIAKRHFAQRTRDCKEVSLRKVTLSFETHQAAALSN
jgi:hypothetical protein